MKSIGILAVLSALAVSSYAQGTVNASNAGGFGVRPIYINEVGGTPAGTSIMVEILAGATEGSLVPLRSGSIAAGGLGLFALGTVAIPDVAPGAAAFVQIRAWDSLTGASYAAATSKGSSLVFSVPVTGGAGQPASTPAALTGFQSFAVIVPEPGVMSLAAIGGLGLLALRRKNA